MKRERQRGSGVSGEQIRREQAESRKRSQDSVSRTARPIASLADVMLMVGDTLKVLLRLIR